MSKPIDNVVSLDGRRAPYRLTALDILALGHAMTILVKCAKHPPAESNLEFEDLDHAGWTISTLVEETA